MSDTNRRSGDQGLAELLALPFAHRGLHGGSPRALPENSLAAVDAAVRRGFGVELDVRLSADGVPVVFHDASLRRLCGVDGKVAQSPAHLLTRMRLAGSDQTIPTLTSAMHTVAGRAPVLVDLKPTAVGQRGMLLDAVAVLLRCYRGPVAVVSFDPWLLAGLRERAPRLHRGHTGGVDPRVADRWWGRVCAPVDDLWALRVSAPDFVAFNVDRLPSRTVDRVRTKMPVLAWTVRTAASYRLARAHADGVIVEDDAVALAERELLHVAV